MTRASKRSQRLCEIKDASVDQGTFHLPQRAVNGVSIPYLCFQLHNSIIAQWATGLSDAPGHRLQRPARWTKTATSFKMVVGNIPCLWRHESIRDKENPKFYMNPMELAKQNSFAVMNDLRCRFEAKTVGSRSFSRHPLNIKELSTGCGAIPTCWIWQEFLTLAELYGKRCERVCFSSI